jgi:FkbM family methyltransferase
VPDQRPRRFNQATRFLVRGLKARFRGQKAELDVIRGHVRPGDTVCDIGANKGSFVYWLSRWCGQGGRVVAFEPQPELARRLAEVCQSLRLSNVTVEAKAVFSHSGQQDLFVPGNHPGASLVHLAMEGESFATLPVPLVSLDDYFAETEKITLLKIDVEGAESGVLRGAERILRQHAPQLVFECENRHLAPGTVDDVFSWLAGLGYQGQFICRNRLYPIAQFDAAIHQRAHGQWFWKSKDYCNNFVFRKPPAA